MGDDSTHLRMVLALCSSRSRSTPLTDLSTDAGKYMFPNDDEESDRLDLYHHVQTLSLGGELHLAPIGDNPQRILGMSVCLIRDL